LRNTRVIDVIEELQSHNVKVDIYDPWVDPLEAEREYDVKPIERPEQGVYDAIVVAVAHQQFCDMGADAIRAFGKKDSVVYDVKHILPASEVDGRL
jgi:UDP-N-acetyl-D-galactosamine dehydrogenase